jgi:hypothetical protein
VTSGARAILALGLGVILASCSGAPPAAHDAPSAARVLSGILGGLNHIHPDVAIVPRRGDGGSARDRNVWLEIRLPSGGNGLGRAKQIWEGMMVVGAYEYRASQLGSLPATGWTIRVGKHKFGSDRLRARFQSVSRPSAHGLRTMIKQRLTVLGFTRVRIQFERFAEGLVPIIDVRASTLGPLEAASTSALVGNLRYEGWALSVFSRTGKPLVFVGRSEFTGSGTAWSVPGVRTS